MIQTALFCENSLQRDSIQEALPLNYEAGDTESQLGFDWFLKESLRC